jgi:hypothetical protein
MVARMDSRELNSSPTDRESFAIDLNLPVFEQPQAEHRPAGMSWLEAVRHFSASRQLYMRKFDSPEKRWREKNPAPFVLH